MTYEDVNPVPLPKNYGKRYWVAAGNSGKIIGVTGLYLDSTDKDVIWLGWFGVHPEFRRQGRGASLLEFTINAATRRGFETLKLYTSTDKSAKAARRLYESYGFKKTHSCRITDKLYYQKELKGIMSMNSKTPDRG